MSPSTNISPLRISNPFINCLLFWCLVRISVLQCPKLAFPSQILSCSSFLCLINDNSILPVAQVNLAFFPLTPYSQSIIVSLLSKYILNTCWLHLRNIYKCKLFLPLPLLPSCSESLSLIRNIFLTVLHAPTFAPSQLILNIAVRTIFCKCRSDHTITSSKPSNSFPFQPEETPTFLQKPTSTYIICIPPIPSWTHFLPLSSPFICCSHSSPLILPGTCSHSPTSFHVVIFCLPWITFHQILSGLPYLF